MDQLKQVIKDRLRRVQEIQKTTLSFEQLKVLKQQEKSIYQKQNWLLSMIRLNKTISKTVKLVFIKESLQIMKIIDYEFSFTIENQQKIEDNFLINFVRLYKNFFDKFQEKFNFKTKIKNFMRPNNQNIIYDLIKYLSDFTRDYYQQVFYWNMRTKKQQIYNSSEFTNIIPISESFDNQTTVKFKSLANIQRKPSICSVMKKTLGKSQQILQNPVNNKKQPQIIRHYEILNIGNLPSIINMEKNVNTIEIMKLRMNQLYRDMKYRNLTIKTIFNNYLNSYAQNFQSIKNNTYSENNSYNKLTHPFRITLTIQKNGFSCINVNLIQRNATIYFKKSQDMNNLMTFSKNFQQQLNTNYKQLRSQFNTGMPMTPVSLKNDYLLSGLKVLRVSENLLPPIIQTSDDSKKQRYNFKNNCKSEEANTIRDFQKLNQQEKQQKPIQKIRYYNMQTKNLQNKRIQQKKRLMKIRKHFTSQEKSKRDKKKLVDPQEKIQEWLGKIKIMKQVEKKKILGIL